MDIVYITAIAAAVALAPAAVRRFRLSRAKHPSPAGHARISKRLARLVPIYQYGEQEFFRCDGAPDEFTNRRRAGLERLSRTLCANSPKTLEISALIRL